VSTTPPPHASEATRLLCAGTYLDPRYRDQVIEQLHLNEQRIVAPSLGLDAARVLAHALRARRQELLWAGLILGLWVVGLPLIGALLFMFLVPSLMLALASRIRGRAAQPPLYRWLPALWLRWSGRFTFAFFLLVTLVAAFGAGKENDPYDSSTSDVDGWVDVPLRVLAEVAGGIEVWRAWLVLVLFALIALCIAVQRGQFARALDAELSPRRFPDTAGDPAEQDESPRFQRLKERIRIEQHAPLVMYHEQRPFCGAGLAVDTWVIAVELKPDKEREQLPLNNRAILEKIRPLLEQLRLPSEFAGYPVRDRLRRLEIDECVFLPVEGLRRREEAPYHPQVFEEHRARAVEEGGERRRHFLRVRVGGWEEELVVTVFVRVHTQGRMLMLEIAPHVLLPVREDFKDADRTAHNHRHNNVLGKAVWALVRVPGSAVRSLVVLGRWLGSVWRLLTGGYAGAQPDGPALSVRELGSAEDSSLFQGMDRTRYLRSIQDRVANGVTTALAECGYETGEFVQKVVHNYGIYNEGDVHNSSLAAGDGATAIFNS
jgi:hypothetical protein